MLCDTCIIHVYYIYRLYTYIQPYPRSTPNPSRSNRISQFLGKLSRSGTLQPLLASIPLQIQEVDFCDCSSKDRGWNLGERVSALRKLLLLHFLRGMGRMAGAGVMLFDDTCVIVVMLYICTAVQVNSNLSKITSALNPKPWGYLKERAPPFRGLLVLRFRTVWVVWLVRQHVHLIYEPRQSVKGGKSIQKRVLTRSPLLKTPALRGKLTFGDPFLP